jgi:hypothetical protein
MMSSLETNTGIRAAVQAGGAIENAPVGRVYPMAWWFRAFSVFFFLFGCFTVGRVHWETFDGQTYQIFGVLLLAVFPLAGAALSIKAFTSKITFNEELIEIHSVWRRRSVRLAVIKGRREYAESGTEGGSTRYLRVEASDGSPALDFGKKFYLFDDAFWRWFNQLPDLDARDKQTHKNSNFGLV